jgi:hypothetical protein
MGVSGQRHAPAALYPRGKDPRYQWTGGWVGPRAGLDTGVRGKILCPCRGSNLNRPVVQPVVRHYSLLTELTRLQWGEAVSEMRLPTGLLLVPQMMYEVERY